MSGEEQVAAADRMDLARLLSDATKPGDQDTVSAWPHNWLHYADAVIAAGWTPPVAALCAPRDWTPDDGDRRCQRCGHPNIVWRADNEVWNYVQPQWGVLCVPCFVEMAEDSGVVPKGAWRLIPDGWKP